MLDDLHEPAHQPPSGSPAQRQPNDGPIELVALGPAVEQPSRHQAGHREQERAQEVLVGDGHCVRRIGEGVLQVPGEGERSQHLQQSAPAQGEQAVPPAAQPHQHQALHRPDRRREVAVQRERNRDGAEGHRQSGVGLRQRPTVDAQPARGQRQRSLDCSQPGRGDGQAVFGVTDRQLLKTQSDERRAEHQRRRPDLALERDVRCPRPIERTPEDRGLTHGEEGRHRHVHQHEQCDEGLRGDPLVLLVTVRQPERGQAEREAEAQKVELGPDLEPGHPQDRRVQHQEEAEDEDMVLGPRVRQHRRQEPADDAQDGQRSRVLKHRQHSRAEGDDHHRRRRWNGWQDVVHGEGGIRGDVQHGDPAALEAEAVDRAYPALAPADGQQHKAEHGRRHQAHLDRQLDDAPPVDLPEQQPHTDERDQHPHLHRRVPGRHPLLDPVDEPRDRIGGLLPAGCATRCRGAGGCRGAGLGCTSRRIGGSGSRRTRNGCSHLGSRFGGDRPHNRRNPDGRFRLLVGLRCRLRNHARLCGHGLPATSGNHARLCGHFRLRLGRLGGGSESREPGVGLLGPDLHLGNPGLHLLDPGLGLLDPLEPLAQVNLLAQQQADGSSCQQPGQSAG